MQIRARRFDFRPSPPSPFRGALRLFRDCAASGAALYRPPGTRSSAGRVLPSEVGGQYSIQLSYGCPAACIGQPPRPRNRGKAGGRRGREMEATAGNRTGVHGFAIRFNLMRHMDEAQMSHHISSLQVWGSRPTPPWPFGDASAQTPSPALVAFGWMWVRMAAAAAGLGEAATPYRAAQADRGSVLHRADTSPDKGARLDDRSRGAALMALEPADF